MLKLGSRRITLGAQWDFHSTGRMPPAPVVAWLEMDTCLSPVDTASDQDFAPDTRSALSRKLPLNGCNLRVTLLAYWRGLPQ